MDFDKLYKKINDNFLKGNYRESFKDLIEIYKLDKKSDISNKIGVVLLKLNKKNSQENFLRFLQKKIIIILNHFLI